MCKVAATSERNLNTMTIRARTALYAALALLAFGSPPSVSAHGNPAYWSAESTQLGCWISRWLSHTPEGGGEEMVGLQIVLGRIVPPRGDLAQPAITKAELEGATTVNVRIVDPSLGNASRATVIRAHHNPLELEKRAAAGDSGEFPSLYVTGAAADSILESLRKGELSAIAVYGPDGREVRFANDDTELRVAIAMYDACIANKPL
jgi:hypothetical protein